MATKAKDGGSLEGEVKEPVERDLRPLNPEMCVGIQRLPGAMGEKKILDFK